MKGFPNKSYYGKHVEINKSKPKPNKARLERKKKAKELLTGRKFVGKPAAKPTAKPARKTIDSFEAEYLKFIAQLKAKKATEEVKTVEIVEPTPAPVVEPEPVVEPTPVVEETPVVVEEQPKKTTRKKKVVEEPVEEFFVSEQPTIDGLD